MIQLFNRIIADLGAYELIMAYVLIAFAALVALRLRDAYASYIARAKARAEKERERRAVEKLASANWKRMSARDTEFFMRAAQRAPAKSAIRPS